MFKKIVEFLRPPSFPDEEKTRLARILYTIQIALVAAALLAAFSSFRLDQSSSVQGLLAACFVIFLTIWLTQKGYLRLASWVMLVATTISVTYLLFVGQGIHDISMMLLPLVVIMGSLLFNRLEFGILNVVVFSGVIFIVHAEVSGTISTNYTQYTEYTDLIFLAVEQALIAIVTRLLARNISQSLNRARQNEHILAEMNRQLSEQAESLRASQELLAEAQRIGNIGHFKWDLENNQLSWSDQMYHIHGLQPGETEITPEVAWNFIHPNDRPSQSKIKEQLEQLDHSQQIISTYRLITFAGLERQVIRTSKKARDARGGLTVIGTVQDITEREQTEISIQRYAHRLEILRQLDYAILAAHSVNEIALEVVQRIRELVPCWRSSISTFDFQTGQATMIAYCERDEPAQITSVHIPLKNFLDLPTLQSGQPVYTDYLSSLGEEKPAAEKLLKEGTRSILGLPIIIQDELVGSLNLEANQPAAFIAEHIEIGQEVTGLLGIALQQARLAAQTAEALERETRLNALARAISSTLDLPLLLEGIMRLTIQLIHADAGTISLVSENGETIEEIYDWKIPAPISGMVLPFGKGLTWVILQSGQPIILNDYSSHPDHLPELATAGIRTLVGAPIMTGNTSLGSLILLGKSENKDYSQRDLDLLESIGRQAGIAVQNARLYNKLQTELVERLRIEEALRRAEQATKEREEIYRRAISAIDAVPYYADYASKSFPFIGEGILRLTGFSQDEVSPEKWKSLVKEIIIQVGDNKISQEEALDKTRRGEIPIWHSIERIITRHGEERWISDTAIVIFNSDGVAYGSIGILQDITELKQAEENARQLNITLEQRVRERTAELEASNRELEAFSYSVSHDLRAPLRGIDGYSKLLLDDYEPIVDDEGKFYLQSIRIAAQKMGQLIDDLLQLSRVTRTEMHRTCVDLSALAGELNAALQEQEPERQMKILIQAGIEVQGDANLLRIMLRNLLENAWKFTSKVSQASIEIGSMEQDNMPVYFVRDNGVGFDMKYANRLFSAFQRLHNPAEFEGTGIGLATVQRVVTRHGGKIWVEAAVDRGASFYFTLGE